MFTARPLDPGQDITPDIKVTQEVPEELKARATSTQGEASLRGHLKAEGDEATGSQSYIPPARRGLACAIPGSSKRLHQ